MVVSFWHILLVLLLVLLLFGAKKLPELARSMGKSLGEFKRGLKEADSKEDDVQSSTLSK